MSLTGFSGGREAAYCPGHVTGFFEIRDGYDDALRRGSRGAGVCLDLGSTAVVEGEASEGFHLEVVLDDEVAEAPVTRTAVAYVLREAALEGKVPVDTDREPGDRVGLTLRVTTEHALPTGQGFGMSGAGALSAALATARLVGVGRTTAVQAAHLAEVEHATGLGDVAAQITGGIEVRTAPGLPPYGSVRRLVGGGQVVLLPMGGELSTAEVLRDPERRRIINEHGGQAVDALLEGPSVERFYRLSQRFATATGLMTEELRKAAEAVADHGAATMAMLGNTLFATGDADAIVDTWDAFGEPRVAEVDPEGVRPLRLRSAEDPAGDPVTGPP